MESRSMRWSVTIALLMVLASAHSPAYCQNKSLEKSREKATRAKGYLPSGEPVPGAHPKTGPDKIAPPATAEFLIGPVEGNPTLFTVTLYDRASRASLTSMYNLNQVRLLEAIMAESQKFAQTGEEVGTTKPLTTRFFSEHEPSFFVDVSKMGNRSQFFVTLKSRGSYVTMDAGTIKRGESDSETILSKFLTKTREVAAAAKPLN